jgi:hypothetical protein
LPGLPPDLGVAVVPRPLPGFCGCLKIYMDKANTETGKLQELTGKLEDLTAQLKV